MSSSICTLSAGTKSCRSLNVRHAPLLLAARRAGSCRRACRPSYLSSWPGRAVDDVDAEVAAPVVAPLGPVEALDDEDQRADVVRDALEPGVVLRREVRGAGREQLDHGAERALGREDRAVGPVARGPGVSGRSSRVRRSPGPAPCPRRSLRRRTAPYSIASHQALADLRSCRRRRRCRACGRRRPPARVPTSRQLGAAGCFSMRTL